MAKIGNQHSLCFKYSEHNHCRHIIRIDICNTNSFLTYNPHQSLPLQFSSFHIIISWLYIWCIFNHLFAALLMQYMIYLSNQRTSLQYFADQRIYCIHVVLEVVCAILRSFCIKPISISSFYIWTNRGSILSVEFRYH